MDKNELLERIRSLIEKTQGVAFIAPEDTGYFSIDDDMVRQVRSLIALSIETLREISDHYEARSTELGEQASSTGEGLVGIGAQISTELAAREVSGLAFVARAQLIEMQQALASALAHRQIWAVASHADSSLRRAGKALIAIESAICEFEGLEAPDRRWTDLEDSLEIRRLYGQFRRAIVRGGDPKGEELARQLRSAATRIAILRDLKIYPFLRLDDRLPIRRLQKRILAWLEQDGEDPEEGKPLWQDLVAFARLLAKVNDREELREHDRQAVATVHRMLFAAKHPPKQIAPGHLKELERLLGRDDELDQMILRPDDHELEDLRDPIERIRNELYQGVPARSGFATFEH